MKHLIWPMSVCLLFCSFVLSDPAAAQFTEDDIQPFSEKSPDFFENLNDDQLGEMAEVAAKSTGGTNKQKAERKRLLTKVFNVTSARRAARQASASTARLPSPDVRSPASSQARPAGESQAALKKHIEDIAEDKVDVKSLTPEALRAALVHAKAMGNETANFKITKELLRRKKEEAAPASSQGPALMPRGEKAEVAAMDAARRETADQEALVAQRRRRAEAARKLEELADRHRENIKAIEDADERPYRMREAQQKKLDEARRDQTPPVVRVPSLPRVTLPPKPRDESAAVQALVAAENRPVGEKRPEAGKAELDARSTRQPTPPAARPAAKPGEFGRVSVPAPVQSRAVGRTTSPPQRASEDLGLSRAPGVEAPTRGSTGDSELTRALEARRRMTDASTNNR